MYHSGNNGLNEALQVREIKTRECLDTIDKNLLWTNSEQQHHACAIVCRSASQLSFWIETSQFSIS